MNPAYVISKPLFCIAAIASLAMCACSPSSPAQKNATDIRSFSDLQNHFKYRGDGGMLVSAHRGVIEEGFPENSLEGFGRALESGPLFFEIDPALTKDGHIVLMHDLTLERTTDGTGKVADYTLEELRRFRLKDRFGNITDCRIPTLEEAIIWSRGKTVLNLDRKGVPDAMKLALSQKLGAQNVIYTTHTGAQAKDLFEKNPQTFFAARIKNQKQLEDFKKSGVPWENVIAYVGQKIDAGNAEVCAFLRSKGVRCFISLAPTADKLPTPEEREKAYYDAIMSKPDCVETDRPDEFHAALKSIDSLKIKYGKE